MGAPRVRAPRMRAARGARCTVRLHWFGFRGEEKACMTLFKKKKRGRLKCLGTFCIMTSPLASLALGESDWADLPASWFPDAGSVGAQLWGSWLRLGVWLLRIIFILLSSRLPSRPPSFLCPLCYPSTILSICETWTVLENPSPPTNAIFTIMESEPCLSGSWAPFALSSGLIIWYLVVKWGGGQYLRAFPHSPPRVKF